MQVDNSGTTVVLDAKTTQAIEEGKNRITMLQVEELRLKNLKKGLEAEIIKLEADIDYKGETQCELTGQIVLARQELKLLVGQVEELKNEQESLHSELRKREEAVQAQETSLHERELALNAEQAKLNDLIERTSKDSLLAEKAKDIADEKMKKIDAFLKSL
jgi:chromosome segregation ATPase